MKKSAYGFLSVIGRIVRRLLVLAFCIVVLYRISDTNQSNIEWAGAAIESGFNWFLGLIRNVVNAF